MITFTDWKNQANYFKYKGKYDIAYWSAGEGIPLLLIHGFPTASWDWHKIWDELAANFKVYAIDMMGFGYSAKPKDYVYSLTDQARLHEAFAQQMGIKEAHLFVHDYGVSVAQEMLASFKERGASGLQILSCSFMNGGLFPELHHARPIQKLLISPLGAFLNRFLNKGSLRRNFIKIYGDKKPTEQDIDQFYRLMEYNDGIQNTYKLMRYIINRRENAQRWKNALMEATIPLQFINGPLDPVSGRHLAEYCKKLLPNSPVVVLEGVGHYPHDEAPERVMDAYLEFVTPFK